MGRFVASVECVVCDEYICQNEKNRVVKKEKKIKGK